MTKHTPGPWRIPEPCMGFTKIEGPNGELIFGLAAGGRDEKQSDEICEANADLVAAAPDLLAALKAVVAIADRKTVEFDIARAAILKAGGQS